MKNKLKILEHLEKAWELMIVIYPKEDKYKKAIFGIESALRVIYSAEDPEAPAHLTGSEAQAWQEGWKARDEL